MRLAFILSLPRSGSTVLSKLLDARQGVICMPESAFPQLLGRLSPSVRRNPEHLAALYLASSFSGTPLSFHEARSCMEGDDRAILVNLGLAMASHTGRDPAQVTTILWKTTRLVSFIEGPQFTDGKFIVLRRNPDNVFDSQFRVPFGVNTRTPIRFSLFQAGYEASFARIKVSHRMDIEYEMIPESIDGVLGFLGHVAKGLWSEGRSSLSGAVESRPWHRQIGSDFRSTDSEKRCEMDPRHLRSLSRARIYTAILRPLIYPLRLLLDRRSMGNTERLAEQILAKHINA